MPTGGHTEPISILGLNLLWKKAQKKEKKNITSETINRTTPNRSPFLNGLVWKPWNVASRTTSRHQFTIVNKTKNKPSKKPDLVENLNQKARPATKQKAPNLPVIGQGEGFTKKKGLLLIVKE